MDEAAINGVQARIADVCGHLNVLHAQLVDMVVEALDDGLWEQWGIRSPEHWLAWQTGLSPMRAAQLVVTARRQADLPKTFAAFAVGELSVDQIAVVAKHAPDYIDGEVVGLAKNATVTQLRTALSRYWHKPEPAKPADPYTPPKHHAAGHFNDDGDYTFHALLPADQGAIVDKALKEARDALFNAGNPDVTWMDAFVEVCNRSLGTVTSTSRRDRYRVYAHIEADDAGVQAWFSAGARLPASIRDSVLCDGTIVPVWTKNSVPVSVGRSARVVPSHTRRLVLDRDRTCRHPSCNATVHLEVHHVIEWIKGGCTDLDNLIALCPKHHDRLHHGRFSMVGNPNVPGGLKFFNEHGLPISPVAKPNPPNGPPPAPPPGHRYTHPLGETLHPHWITFNTSPAA